MFYATMPTGRHEVVGLSDHEGLWSEKEEFWRNKSNGDFWEKVLNETSYKKKNRFMGKVLKAFFPFSIKIWRFQNKVLLNKSISFSFHQGYRVFKPNEVLFKQ